jgi:hypothetical protein
VTNFASISRGLSRLDFLFVLLDVLVDCRHTSSG